MIKDVRWLQNFSGALLLPGLNMTQNFQVRYKMDSLFVNSGTHIDVGAGGGGAPAAFAP